MRDLLHAAQAHDHVWLDGTTTRVEAWHFPEARDRWADGNDRAPLIATWTEDESGEPLPWHNPRHLQAPEEVAAARAVIVAAAAEQGADDVREMPTLLRGRRAAERARRVFTARRILRWSEQ